MIEPTYTKEIIPEYDCFDRYDRILPAKVLEMFQDISGAHAEKIGCGYRAALSRGGIWIVVRSHLDIWEEPKEGEPLTIKTRVKKPLGLSFIREYKIRRNSDSRLIISGQATWCLADCQTRKLTRLNGLPYPDTYEEEQLYPKPLTAIHPFTGELNTAFTKTIRFTDIDHNGHMNNCRYADLVMDAIAPERDRALKSFEIDFESECYQGETIDIQIGRYDSQQFFVQGVKSSGKNSFRALATFF